jgi:hypothetical protein
MSAVEYKQNAANCINAAAATTDPAIRASMLAMASSWLHLAEQAEKNSTADLVYETRPPRVDPRKCCSNSNSNRTASNSSNNDSRP